MAAGRLFEGGDRPSLRERRLLGGYLSRISRGHLVQSHCRLGITHIADEPDLAGALDLGQFEAAQGRAVGVLGVTDDPRREGVALEWSVSFTRCLEISYHPRVYVRSSHHRATPDIIRGCIAREIFALIQNL